jgi:hypothetical protein
MTTGEIFRLVKDIMGKRLGKPEELVARASRPFLASPFLPLGTIVDSAPAGKEGESGVFVGADPGVRLSPQLGKDLSQEAGKFFIDNPAMIWRRFRVRGTG